MQIGFIGTGTMGNPMSRCLIDAGHQLTVNDLRREATTNLCELGAQWADSPQMLPYDMCQDLEVPIVRGLGRHTNDHMTSFYMKTPSGFDVEYGWGAREVDDATWQVQRHEKGSIWGHRPMAAAAR